MANCVQERTAAGVALPAYHLLIMKHFVTSVVAAASAGLAFGGSTYVAPPAPYVPAPVVENDLDWFMGASAGYLEFVEEPMYTFHIGREVGEVAGWTSSIFLEGGYTQFDQSRGGVRADADVIPITLNYKLDKDLAGGFGIYTGLGAGIAYIDSDLSGSGNNFDDDDTPFYGQAFLGLEAELTESFEIFGGARYIYLDEPDLTFNNVSSNLGNFDGFFYEGGLRIKF